MNTNGLLNWLFRRFLGKAINHGIDRAAGGGKAKADMTPEERRQAKQARQTAKRARQAAKITRRIMR